MNNQKSAWILSCGARGFGIICFEWSISMQDEKTMRVNPVIDAESMK